MNRSTPHNYILWGFILIAIVSAVLLTVVSVTNDSNNVLSRETRFRNELSASPVSLDGRILSGDGKPLGGAIVTLQDQAAVSLSDGSFIVQEPQPNEQPGTGYRLPDSGPNLFRYTFLFPGTSAW